jgi:hypothetical protein
MISKTKLEKEIKELLDELYPLYEDDIDKYNIVMDFIEKMKREHGLRVY